MKLLLELILSVSEGIHIISNDKKQNISEKKQILKIKVVTIVYAHDFIISTERNKRESILEVHF